MNIRRISPRLILSAIGLSVCLPILIFIVNNLNSQPSSTEPLPVKCDCPTLPPPPPKIETVAPLKIEVPFAPKIDATTSTQTPPPLPPCKPVEKESPVQRAIIIYYPHHQSEYFFPEVRWYV